MYLDAFNGKTVLITGHTGFKGTWLAIYLELLGAHVVGYALDAPTIPSIFEMTGLADKIEHIYGDIRDLDHLQRTLAAHRPDYIFHLAAQALVIESYAEPYATFEINTMGSIAVMEAIRAAKRPVTAIMVTTDKCYENNEWVYGYRETDPMGGRDPYSASKGAMELAVASYRRSFFAPEQVATHGIRLASARAGNVIGGGDWAKNRIVPDTVRALSAKEPIKVRNPHALRPWQHVLEPLSGYLWLAASLTKTGGENLAGAWNFGPLPTSTASVQMLVETSIRMWGTGAWVDASNPAAPHEAQLLHLAIDKAVIHLGWQPVWDIEDAVSRTIGWYRKATQNNEATTIYQLCVDDIEAYNAAAREKSMTWAQ